MSLLSDDKYIPYWKVQATGSIFKKIAITVDLLCSKSNDKELKKQIQTLEALAKITTALDLDLLLNEDKSHE